jgi:hypothetical protein
MRNFVDIDHLLRILGLHGVHLIFLFVEVSEQDPEGDTGDGGSDADSSVHPDEFGIDGDGGKSDGESGTEGSLEQEHRHDERLHAGWRLGVSVFETGDGGEDLGEGNEDVRGGLPADVDGAGVGASGEIVARTCGVNPMLFTISHGSKRLSWVRIPECQRYKPWQQMQT